MVAVVADGPTSKQSLDDWEGVGCILRGRYALTVGLVRSLGSLADCHQSNSRR